jgi:hypothetical protein
MFMLTGAATVVVGLLVSTTAAALTMIGGALLTAAGYVDVAVFPDLAGHDRAARATCR